MLTLVLLWEAAVRLLRVEPWLLPAPSLILTALGESWPLFWKHTQVTLYESLLGFVASVALAFALALIMDSLPLVRRALYPVLVTTQTVPIISVAPLFLIWFGYGLAPKILVVVLVCFFPVVVSLLQGLAAVDEELLDLLRSMNASRMAQFRLAKLPAALPSLFSGLKIAATYSIMGAVIGEWLGAQAGLGYYMTLSQRSFLTARVFAVILIITVLSLGVFKVIELLEGLFMPWRRLKSDD